MHSNATKTPPPRAHQLSDLTILWHIQVSHHTTIIHGHRKDFSAEELVDLSQSFSWGGAKVVECVFSHSKLRRQPFLLKFSKPPLPPFRRPRHHSHFYPEQNNKTVEKNRNRCTLFTWNTRVTWGRVGSLPNFCWHIDSKRILLFTIWSNSVVTTLLAILFSLQKSDMGLVTQRQSWI